MLLRVRIYLFCFEFSLGRRRRLGASPQREFESKKREGVCAHANPPYCDEYLGPSSPSFFQHATSVAQLANSPLSENRRERKAPIEKSGGRTYLDTAACDLDWLALSGNCSQVVLGRYGGAVATADAPEKVVQKRLS